MGPLPILVSLGSGIACMLIARNRNRSRVIWLSLGVIFPLISLVILLASKPLTEPKSPQQDVGVVAKVILAGIAGFVLLMWLGLSVMPPSELSSRQDSSSPTSSSRVSVPSVLLPDLTAGLEVVSVETKITDRSAFLWTFSYKLTVKNNADSERTGIMKLIWTDADGFAVSEEMLMDLTVAPRQTKTFTGTHIVEPSVGEKIKSIQAASAI